jgi:hypothetical protein
MVERDLNAIRQEVIESFDGDIDEVRALLNALRTEFGPRMEVYSQRLQALWQAMSADLADRTPDLDDYPRPEAREACEIGDGLYNSERSYLEQIDAYKRFQGKMKESE